MADSVDDKQDSSDQYSDLFCDPCFDGKGLKVKVHGYCKDCFQFLCSDCNIIHGQLHVSRRHVILQGANMPQSQADKPPKFEYCDLHPKSVKDKFCYAHKTLICCSCAFIHRKCVVETVADICKTVKSSDTDSLYASVIALHDQGKSVLMEVQANIKKAKEQKKQMLKEAQLLYDEVISKMKKLFQDMQSEIEAAYQSQALLMSQQQERIESIVSRLESSLNDIEKFRGKPVDTKLFLKIQESVSDTNQVTGELRSLNESLLFADLSLIPSKPINDILCTIFTFGSVSKLDNKPDTNIVVSEILFPGPTHISVLPLQLSNEHSLGATSIDTKPSMPLKQKEVVKEGTYRVKKKKDKYDCFITGLAIAKGGKKLMTDHVNSKVKLFSHDLKFLSAVSFPDRPLDVAMISDKKAIVTTANDSLVILDISGRRLSINTTTQLSYNVYGISRYNDKLVVTSPGSLPPSVKLIDQTGRVYWSVSTDQQGQPLFSTPWHVSSHGDGRSSAVIVTEPDNGTLTLLNGDTGEVSTRRQLKERKGLCGVATDSVGNVYVCNYNTEEVAVLSGDISGEEILLSCQAGPSGCPKAIVYDNTNHQIIISYVLCNFVDCFKLS